MFSLFNLGRSESFKEKLVCLTIGGEPFYIPRSYIWGYENAHGDNLQTIDLQTLYPNFEGYNERTKNAFDGVSWHDEIMFQLSPRSSSTFSPEQQIDLDLALNMEDCRSTKVDDFDVYCFKGGEKELLVTELSHNSRLALICDSHDKEHGYCKGRITLNDAVEMTFVFSRMHLKDWYSIYKGLVRLAIVFYRGEDVPTVLQRIGHVTPLPPAHSSPVQADAATVDNILSA